MTVRVYASNDASAPTLNGTADSLCNVLNAILVTGYGAAVAAGWAREFDGVNKSVFRAASGNRLRLRVDDTGGQEARLVGYETMTDVDTGTNPFPTAAQVSGGLYLRKSNTADATSRAWYCIATETMFYLVVNTASASTDPSATTAIANMCGLMFGDFTSYKSGDTYNTIIAAQVVTGTSVGRFGELANTSTFTASVGHYIARNNAQVAGAVPCAKSAALGLNMGNATCIGSGTATNYPAYPDPVTGGLLLSPILVIENGGSNAPLIRGVLPGLWAPLHSSPANHFDTLSGSGVTAGKTFRLVDVSAATALGRALFETSNTW